MAYRIIYGRQGIRRRRLYGRICFGPAAVAGGLLAALLLSVCFCRWDSEDARMTSAQAREALIGLCREELEEAGYASQDPG